METKTWYQSSTIWASLGTVVISLASVFGHQINPALVPEIAQNLALLANAFSGLWAIRGRLSATSVIE